MALIALVALALAPPRARPLQEGGRGILRHTGLAVPCPTKMAQTPTKNAQTPTKMAMWMHSLWNQQPPRRLLTCPLSTNSQNLHTTCPHSEQKISAFIEC